MKRVINEKFYDFDADAGTRTVYLDKQDNWFEKKTIESLNQVKSSL